MKTIITSIAVGLVAAGTTFALIQYLFEGQSKSVKEDSEDSDMEILEDEAPTIAVVN